MTITLIVSLIALFLIVNLGGAASIEDEVHLNLLNYKHKWYSGSDAIIKDI